MDCILRTFFRLLSGEWLRGGQGEMHMTGRRLPHFPVDDIYDLAGCGVDEFEGHV